MAVIYITDVFVDNLDDYELIDTLLNYDPLLIDSCGYDTLIGSITFDDIEIVQLLINHGIDVNANDGKALLTDHLKNM